MAIALAILILPNLLGGVYRLARAATATDRAAAVHRPPSSATGRT